MTRNHAAQVRHPTNQDSGEVSKRSTRDGRLQSRGPSNFHLATTSLQTHTERAPARPSTRQAHSGHPTGRGPHPHPAVPDQWPRVHGDGQPLLQGRDTCSQQLLSHSWDTRGADSAPPQCVPPPGPENLPEGPGGMHTGSRLPHRPPQPETQGAGPQPLCQGQWK